MQLYYSQGLLVMAKTLSLVAYNDLDSQVAALERDGYVYFPKVLDRNEQT